MLPRMAAAMTALVTSHAGDNARRLVLTCSRAATLKLADSLTEAGYEAWAPRERIDLHARRGHKRDDTAAPIMPGFVFARVDQLADLLRLSRSPSLLYQVWDAELRKMVTKGHPHFRLWRPFGEFETVPERQLAHLRRLDGLRRPKGPVKAWAVGEAFRLAEGAYAGLSGTVLAIEGDMAKIRIGEWKLEPTIPAAYLQPLDEPADVKLNPSASERATPAQAA